MFGLVPFSWRQSVVCWLGVVWVLGFLGACASTPADPDGVKFSSQATGVAASPRTVVRGSVPKGGGRRHVGKPYRVAGRWYYPKSVRKYEKVGLSSWYGSAFHGRKTANGEVFDMGALSAAHRTLPLPSYVRITHLKNGRSVVLRVNDRGPFAGDRLLDVSRRAAQVLGFIKSGVARVRIRYLGPARLDGKDDWLKKTFAAPKIPAKRAPSGR